MVRSSDRSDRDEVANLRPLVEATLTRVLGSNDVEFEDLVQCSLERLMKAIDRGLYRSDTPLRAWAVAVTRNVAMDRIRRRMRDRRLFASATKDEWLDDRPSVASGPEDLAEMRQLLRKIDAALARLPEDKRESLLLHAAHGYSLTKIASIMGISTAAAQSRMVRARRDLLDALLASGHIEPRSPVEKGDGGAQ